MKKSLLVFVVIFGLVAFYGLTTAAAENEIKKGDIVFICKGGADCGKFETAVKDSKDCKCGVEAEKTHVIKVDGAMAVLCQCGAKCTCELNANNPYQCGCGKPVRVTKIVK